MATDAARLDLARALLDPASTFDTPEAVTRNEELSTDHKIEILRRWAYDASELAVAEEEGMGGGERSRLDDVLQALNELTGGAGLGTLGARIERGHESWRNGR